MIKGYETIFEEIQQSNFSPEEKFRLENFVSKLFEFNESKSFGSIPQVEPIPAPAPIEPPKKEEEIQILPPPVNVEQPKKQRIVKPKKEKISLKDLGIEEDLDKLLEDLDLDI